MKRQTVQSNIVSKARENLLRHLHLSGAEVTIPVTLKAWRLGVGDVDIAGGKSAFGSIVRHSKVGNSPVLLIHYSGTFLLLFSSTFDFDSF